MGQIWLYCQLKCNCHTLVSTKRQTGWVFTSLAQVLSILLYTTNGMLKIYNSFLMDAIMQHGYKQLCIWLLVLQLKCETSWKSTV